MLSNHAPVQHGGCWPTPLQEKLLQAALGSEAVALKAWQEWRKSVDLDRLDRASERMLPLLESNLRRIGVQDPVLSRFSRIAREGWHHNQMILARGAQVLRALEAEGIPTLVFKGAGLVQRYYDDCALRPMNDFDVLVPTAQTMQAFRWALSQGWEFDTDEDPALLTETYLENVHGQGFRNAQGQSFDLHRHLLHHVGGPDADKPFWEASVPLQIHGVTSRTLCTTDHLLVALVHGVRWDDTSPLRWVADALVIIQSAPEDIDWHRLYAHASTPNLLLPIQTGLNYLKSTFDAPIPDGLLRDLAKRPVSLGQKLEFAGRTTSHETHSPFMRLYLRYLTFNQWEISEGWQGKVFGLPRYLQHAWQLPSLWHLPFYAYVRGIRQVRAHLQSRFK